MTVIFLGWRSRNRGLVDENKLCKLDQSLTLNDLTNDQYQVLIGCLLGDGSVKKNGSGGKNRDKWKMKNFIFHCSHNEPQLDYIDWKTKMLSVFLPKTGSIRLTDRGKQKKEFWTVSHPIFTNLRDRFYATRYKSNKSIIPMDMIEKLDALGLLVWYLDDGYLGVRKDGRAKNGHRRRPYPKITAKGYKFAELQKAAEILNVNLGLHLYAKRYKHHDTMNNLICFPAKDRDFIFPIWQDLASKHNLPEMMLYKINLHEWRSKRSAENRRKKKEAKLAAEKNMEVLTAYENHPTKSKQIG